MPLNNPEILHAIFTARYALMARHIYGPYTVMFHRDDIKRLLQPYYEELILSMSAVTLLQRVLQVEGVMGISYMHAKQPILELPVLYALREVNPVSLRDLIVTPKLSEHGKTLTTATVVGLCFQIVVNKEYSLFPILADALEDADCRDEESLSMMRLYPVAISGVALQHCLAICRALWYSAYPDRPMLPTMEENSGAIIHEGGF